MTNRTGCVLVITPELTVGNPVSGFRTSYCGGPRFKYRSEISYLPSSIWRKVGMQATADSFHIPSSCPPVQAVAPPVILQSAPRTPLGLLWRLKRGPALPRCQVRRSLQDSNTKHGRCSLQGAVVEKLVKEFRPFLKPWSSRQQLAVRTHPYAMQCSLSPLAPTSKLSFAPRIFRIATSVWAPYMHVELHSLNPATVQLHAPAALTPLRQHQLNKTLR